jgi:hypothetical protein
VQSATEIQSAWRKPERNRTYGALSASLLGLIHDAYAAGVGSLSQLLGCACVKGTPRLDLAVSSRERITFYPVGVLQKGTGTTQRRPIGRS